MQIISLLNQSAEDKQDASQHPGLNGCETFGLGSISGDRVENVDQDEK